MPARSISYMKFLFMLMQGLQLYSNKHEAKCTCYSAAIAAVCALL